MDGINFMTAAARCSCRVPPFAVARVGNPCLAGLMAQVQMVIMVNLNCKEDVLRRLVRSPSGDIVP